MNENLTINNPTDTDRHRMLKKLLQDVGRVEDYNNIINLLTPPVDIDNYISPGKLRGEKIGIIGGGLAGLSSAFELRQTGANITIFEAVEDRIGGRVNTHYFDKDKMIYGELGPMRIPISHETTWHYINKFKLNTTSFTYANPNAFIYVNKTRARNTDSSIKKCIYPKYNLTTIERNTNWSDIIDYTQFPLKELSSSKRTELIKILPHYSPKYSKLLKLNLRQVYELLGLSNEAINLITSIDSLQRGFLYSDYSETLQDLYTVDFGLLYQIEKGMSNLPLAFYNSLISRDPKEYNNLSNYHLGKVSYKKGHNVKGIYYKNNKIILKYQTRINSNLFSEFDYVICAIPFTSLRTIDINPYFSNLKMQAIREVTYLNSTRAIFFCKSRFWEKLNIKGGGISYTDLPLQTIVYPSYNYLYKDVGILVAAYNLGNDAIRLGNMKKSEQFEFIKRNLEEIHGLPLKYLDDLIIDYEIKNWNDEPYIKGAFTNYAPEQRKLFGYCMIQPEYNNRLIFAGEHITAKHGWMQSALYSGKEAANKLAYYSKLNN